MTELPWSTKSKTNTDLNNAQKILDEDHYGLEKVKERQEFLAFKKEFKNERANIMFSRTPWSRKDLFRQTKKQLIGNL